MAFINHSEYVALGYSVIPDSQFPRWVTMAENAVRRMIDYRPFILVTDDPAPYNEGDPEHWGEQNKRGVCETAEAYFYDANPQLDNENKVVSSFSNQKYSETYVTRKQASADTIKTVDQAVAGIVLLYFTPNQLYRGVD